MGELPLGIFFPNTPDGLKAFAARIPIEQLQRMDRVASNFQVCTVLWTSLLQKLSARKKAEIEQKRPQALLERVNHKNLNI